MLETNDYQISDVVTSLANHVNCLVESLNELVSPISFAAHIDKKGTKYIEDKLADLKSTLEVLKWCLKQHESSLEAQEILNEIKDKEEWVKRWEQRLQDIDKEA